MSEIFFTSDTHFGHQPEFLWKPRGFSSVEEMDETIIENWNKTVPKDGIVYHLGDTMLNNNEHGLECFKRLNGQIFLIYGNHDTDARKDLLFTELRGKMLGGWYAWLIKYGKLSIYMSHYPTLTSNYDEKHFSQHVLSLHGHTHQRTNWLDPKNPFLYHVGLDSHNNTPVHIDEVITDIRQRWEEIGRLPVQVQPQDTYPYGGLINEN
jgi:calcineurin-like phosphoesterase family protein